MAVSTSDPLTRDMLAYSRLIIREALRHGSTGWLQYDRIFRRQVAIDPSLPWNTLQAALQASTILGQPSSAGTFCNICRECDHSQHNCAMGTSSQPVTPTVSTITTTTTAYRPPRRSIRTARRPETALGICISWNKGTCSYPGTCTFRHVCATCHLGHMARDCPSTPSDSEYKRPWLPRANPLPPISLPSSRR